jgi:hypothetical protein
MPLAYKACSRSDLAVEWCIFPVFLVNFEILEFLFFPKFSNGQKTENCAKNHFRPQDDECVQLKKSGIYIVGQFRNHAVAVDWTTERGRDFQELCTKDLKIFCLLKIAPVHTNLWKFYYDTPLSLVST